MRVYNLIYPTLSQLGMAKQITTEIINSLLDEYRGTINHQDDCSAKEVRARIIYAFKFGYEMPEIPTDPSLNRL